VSDNALVVYQGACIIGVKHREISPWLVWDGEELRWHKALPRQAVDFDRLPLVGSVQN
jgi:hypothetical protein